MSDDNVWTGEWESHDEEDHRPGLHGSQTGERLWLIHDVEPGPK